jgi:hypothetical protein
MSFSLTTFINDVKLEVAAALPDVIPAGETGGGVIDAEHESRIAWAKLKLPIAVVVCNRFTPPMGNSRGVNTLAFEFPVRIYYVRLCAARADSVRLKLEDLLNHFWPVDPLRTRGHGQRVRMGEWGYDESLPCNIPLRDANRAQWGGMVELICVAGVRRVP